MMTVYPSIYLSVSFVKTAEKKNYVLGDTGQETACLQAQLIVYIPALEVEDFSAADQT